MTALTPITVESPDSVVWDEVADVIVVGFGGAGAAAALQARECGAEVIVLDRFGGGGTTAYSGGVLYAGGTRFQREAGVDDDAENLEAYLAMEVGDVVRPETLRRFCQGSGADVEWLGRHGVKYASELFLEKATFPPEGKYLYYSGNEKSPAFAARARPAPRGHRAVGPGYGGPHYFAALAKAVDREGARVRLHTIVVAFIVDAAGRVVGVDALSVPAELKAEHQRLYESASPWIPHNGRAADRAAVALRELETRAGTPVRIRARAGVVLCTGGFTYNREMLAEHAAPFARHYGVIHRLAAIGSDGSGIALGQTAGGAVSRMDSLYVARNISPPAALLDGVIVNRAGARFVAEDAYTSVVGGAIASQADGQAWLIVPAASLRRALVQVVSAGWHQFKFFGLPMLANIALGGTKRGGIDSLARAAGIDSVGLRATIGAHDADLARGAPDAAGKIDALRAPLGKGPFYAINVSVSNPHAFTPFMTLGGLTVEETSGAVTRADGSAVAGLYAAGLCAVGLHSNGYISGISLSDGVFAGRRAGRAAAANVTRAEKSAAA
ncbi:MAG TPA: FAD-binding protein [Caulobacteraceae bacterium]